MEPLYDGVLAVHIVAVLNAVPAFWLAVALEKGSAQHRRAGRLFVRSMWAVLVSGGLLALALVWDPLRFEPPGPEVADVAGYIERVRRLGTLLVVIVVLVLWLLGFGQRALRRGRSAREARADRSIAAALAGTGALAIPASQLPGLDVLDGGGVLLLIVATIHWARSKRTAPASRLVDHVAGMLGVGTLLHGAVAIQVLPRLVGGFEGERMFDAAMPVLGVGVLLSVWACMRYRRRLAGARTRGAREGLELLAEWAADPL